jgi:metallophosphoesterase superfamily enzyme
MTAARNCRAISTPSCACTSAANRSRAAASSRRRRKIVLPAFGALTGGLDVDHPALVKAVGQGAEALVPVEQRLLRFPIAA